MNPVWASFFCLFFMLCWDLILQFESQQYFSIRWYKKNKPAWMNQIVLDDIMHERTRHLNMHNGKELVPSQLWFTLSKGFSSSYCSYLFHALGHRVIMNNYSLILSKILFSNCIVAECLVHCLLHNIWNTVRCYWSKHSYNFFAKARCMDLVYIIA